MFRARVTKVGGGVLVAEGAAIRLHVRSAAEIADFENDALVIASTYTTGKPVLVRVDREVLRAEIYSAIVGQRVGSTVIVPMRGNDDTATVYAELWIVDIQDGEGADRVNVTTLYSGMTPDVKASLARSLFEATLQQNGYVVRVALSDESDLLEVIDSLRVASGASAPHKLGGRSGSEAVSYLVSVSLYKSLRAAITENEKGG